jgi:hypothetical protein
MSQVKGLNFLLEVNYCDFGNKIGVDASLYDVEAGAVRKVSAQLDCSATYFELADALEALAKRIRGL